MRTLIALLTITICAATGLAQVVQIADEVTIAGGGSQEFSFTAPQVPEDQIPVLHFRGRLQYERQAGHTGALLVYLNGRELSASSIVNKPQELESASGEVSLWWSGGFRLMYSPDFVGNDQAGNPYYVRSGQAYAFDLDLSGVLQPGENTLRLAHAQTDPDFPHAVILADLSVRAQEPPAATRTPAAAGPLPFIAPETDHREHYQATGAPGGGIAVTIGGRTFAVESGFSHERGGWNTLGAPGGARGEEGWAPQVGLLEGGFVVRATAADYTLERRVYPRAEYIAVEDTVTNTSGRDLALLQRHTVDVTAAAEIYLAGLPTKSGELCEPANPTALAIFGDSQIGLTPSDDILRVQAHVFADEHEAGIRNSDGALAAGATETYWWEIYPSATTGYFEMVNAIRRARDANFTIPGGFCFIDPIEPFLSMSDAELRAWLDAKAATIAAIDIHVPRYKGKHTHGTAFLLVDHTIKREFAQRLRRVKPGIQVLIYFHCHVSTEDEAPEKYVAERLLGPDGTQQFFREPIYPLFMPLPGSAYAEAMREFVRIIFDDIGADGVYWDEIDYTPLMYHYGEPWDGRSADADPDTLTIARRKTSVALVTQPFRLPLAREILDRAVLVGNSAPYTASMAQLHFPRFVETAAVSNLRRGHLYTPIGLGDHLSERTTRDCVNAMRRHLTWGSLYYFYHQRIAMDYPSIAAQMFPCTPLELHSGYILGEERILTNTSGNFGWGDASEFAVHVYGADGREVPDFAAPVIEHEGGRYVELRLPWDYMAVIVRKR